MLMLSVGVSTAAGTYVQYYWVGYWATDEFAKGSERPGYWFYVTVFAALIVGDLVFLALRSVFNAHTSRAASHSLHKDLLHCVFRGASEFYDRTPVGWAGS